MCVPWCPCVSHYLQICGNCHTISYRMNAIKYPILIWSHLKTLMHREAYMHMRNLLSLLEKMAPRLWPVTCQAINRIKIDSEVQTVSLKVASKYTHFFNGKYLWKYHWQNGDPSREESTLRKFWLTQSDKHKSTLDRAVLKAWYNSYNVNLFNL